jgi:hypothetical protein
MTNEPKVIAAVEAVLSSSFGTPIRLSGVELLGGSNRSKVTRCYVAEALDAPTSVIVKQVVGDENAGYDPENSHSQSPAWRLFNDWAGAQFLTRVVEDLPPGPRFYGGDKTTGLIVLEDLGASDTLADLLLGVDAAPAEAALISFAATLGRMHALTVGRANEYAEIRDALATGAATVRAPLARPNLGDDIRRFKQGCDALGVQVRVRLDDELRLVAASIQEPGPFLAYTHGDPCPDNALYSNGNLRLVDFEFGGFGHALLDAAYGRMPFPTCWCVNRLPVAIPTRMEFAYRAELVKGCPEASDDRLFYPALVEACACWMITTTSWHLEKALSQDGQWGIATMRQRVLMRLDAFVRVAEQFGYLEATAATAADMAARARALWPPEADEAPSYPAFR